MAVEAREITVLVDGDLAVAYALTKLTGHKKSEGDVQLWSRMTLVFRRSEGAWKIVHEHTSVPLEMDGSGRAATNLTP